MGSGSLGGRVEAMIAVVDYGMGNLHSIAKALEEVGGDVRITGNHDEIRSAERIVLPGVGAFNDGMKNMYKLGLDDVLKVEVIKNKKPFLGICLGMQLIAKKSEEFGNHEGLGWIDADVMRFSFSDKELRVPHVGWNTVRFTKSYHLCAGIGDEADFYFVHSYHTVPVNQDIIAGTCDYGSDFVACISQENIFATQFHPEKSQRDGLTMLKNFLTWSPFI